jgi:hypothetical protein
VIGTDGAAQPEQRGGRDHDRPVDHRHSTWARALKVARWLIPIVVSLALATFIVVVIRPFDDTSDPEADDVATAWNASIARLGILPVFPPEEDLHVGDLWGVIAGNLDTPLLGKAVRLTHIDIRSLIAAARNGQPVFPDTAPRAAGDPFRNQPRTEIAAVGDAINLSLAAFPGITIRHSKRATASGLSRILGGLAAGREDFALEEIRIPTAETYGVQTADAIGLLDGWCRAPKTHMYCTDRFVRQVVAFAVDDRVTTLRDGHFAVPLQLQLVTRVFLTREIDSSRLRAASAGIAGRMGAQTTAEGGRDAATPATGDDPPSAAAEARGRAALDARDAANRAALDGAPAGATAQMLRADGTEIALRQVFQRPLVFGYRAVTVALPQEPPKEASPK